MVYIKELRIVQGKFLIEKFGDSEFTTFYSMDSYGNVLDYNANELDPETWYHVEYSRMNLRHPITEMRFIKTKDEFDFWY